MHESARTPEEQPSEIELLETEARKQLGDETVDERINGTTSEFSEAAGVIDQDLHEDKEKDPLHKRWREVARSTAIKNLATGLGIAAVGGAIVYLKHRFESDEED